MSKNRPEKVEEKKFVLHVEARGGECVKQATFGPYGRVGLNDRITLLPLATTILFEFKRIGEFATRIQKNRHKKLRKLGFKCYVVYTCKEAIEICKRVLRAKGLSAREYPLWC